MEALARSNLILLQTILWSPLPDWNKYMVVEVVLNTSLKTLHLQAKTLSHKLSNPKTLQNRPPDHILKESLYHSELKNLAQTTRTISVA